MPTEEKTYRSELQMDTMPIRMQELPVHRGYPVPWFVDWLDDHTPEFRAMDPRKFALAVNKRLCWVCGQKLGKRLAFVLGPMCGITRVTSEPPCHYTCADWSAKNCPFLARPHMIRREGDAIADEMKDNFAGVLIGRNPGVALIWVTESYTVFNDGKGKPLIEVGEPQELFWLSQGAPATREQVDASIESGLPILFDSDPAARANRDLIEQYRRSLDPWLPTKP